MSGTLSASPLLARAGDWLARHRGMIIGMQWLVVLFYASLLIIPVALPLPDSDARILNNLTVFAQFLFWGIWWPFVLLSMVLLGRAWCGVLCPEGALSEFTSRFGLDRAMPRWLRWSGWPSWHLPAPRFTARWSACTNIRARCWWCWAAPPLPPCSSAWSTRAIGAPGANICAR